MKFKLDENIGRRGLELLRGASHDVVTTRDEGLAGAEDEQIFSVVVSESRALITLDYDFAQVLRFPPHRGTGIAVLDLGGRASLEALLDRLRALLTNLESHPIAGRLGLCRSPLVPGWLLRAVFGARSTQNGRPRSVSIQRRSDVST